MKEQSSRFEEEKKDQEWAHQVADRLGVEFDEAKEQFIVPLYDEQGTERGKEIIPMWRTIPFKDSQGITHQLAVEKAIEALKKYSHLNLSEAIQKQQEEEKKFK